MGVKISKLYGMDIYSDGAEHVGKVNDIILNLERGEVIRITTEPLKKVSKQHAKKLLREKSILYKNVVSVRDIVLVSKRGALSPDEIDEVQTEIKSSGKPRRSSHPLTRARR